MDESFEKELQQITEHWLTLPASSFSAAAPPGGKRIKQEKLDKPSQPSQKTKSDSSKSQAKLRDKILVNLDTRIRGSEGIVEEAISTPSTLPEAEAAVEAGKDYAEAVKVPKHGKSAPHLHIWAAFARVLVKTTTNQKLREMLVQHIKAYSEPRLLKRGITYFTAHLQRDKTRTTITIAFHPSQELLWEEIRKELLNKGAEAKDDMPPRGPMIRTLQEQMSLAIFASMSHN